MTESQAPYSVKPRPDLRIVKKEKPVKDSEVSKKIKNDAVKPLDPKKP